MKPEAFNFPFVSNPLRDMLRNYYTGYMEYPTSLCLYIILLGEYSIPLGLLLPIRKISKNSYLSVWIVHRSSLL